MAYNFTKDDVLEAIKGTQGIISKIQKKLEAKAQHKSDGTQQTAWSTAGKKHARP